MHTTHRFLLPRLSFMMFLQFFIWGAWYVAIAVYMRAEGMAGLTHWPFTVFPVAAIVAPFFLGLVADRYFPSEKVFGSLHILGGITMFIIPSTTANPVLFILMLLLFSLFYTPTMGLANSLSFHNIESQENQFPKIRVFGTIGWIVAGLLISFVLAGLTDLTVEATPIPLYTSGAASLLLGLYSFTLPHTPPPARGDVVSIRSIIGLDALDHLGSKPFWIFIISSFLICIPLAAYFNFTQLFLEDTGFENIAATQSIGQMSEVIFMLLIPFFFRRLGVKWMLGVGMLAWVVRYLLFAMAAPDEIVWMILVGVALHGICFDFFFVTGQIYVDKKSTSKVRGQAQGFLVLVTYGLGMLIGAQVAGNIYRGFLGDQETLALEQWVNFWIIPAVVALIVFIFFVFTFHDKVDNKSGNQQKNG